jgi:hypothetical protein
VIARSFLAADLDVLLLLESIQIAGVDWEREMLAKEYRAVHST